MSTEQHCLMVGSQAIDDVITKGQRKTLEVAVEQDIVVVVVVAAPLDVSLYAIICVCGGESRIMRQQRYFSLFLPRTSQRQFFSRETLLTIIALGALTFSMTALSGTPAIQCDPDALAGR